MGKIDFPTTGTAPARAHFVRGVLALHSFFYEEALDEFRATGSRCFLAYWDAFQADALSAQGDSTQAFAVLDRAFAQMEATNERWAEPELHRIRGMLLERRGDDPAAVEASYRRALTCATALRAKAWELRAEASLAALLPA